MLFNDILMIIRKKIFEKRNIILIIILTLLLIIILSCLSAIYFIQDYKNTSLKNDFTFREFLVMSESHNFEPLNDIEHIEYYANSKFSQILYTPVAEFDSSITKGQIAIKPLINLNDVTIIDGKNITSKYEMICPQKFYPYTESKYNTKTKIYYSKFLDGSKYINKTIAVKPYVYKYYEKEKDLINFKIVGTYKPVRNAGSVQTCYVNKDAFDEIYTNIETIEIYTTGGKEYKNIIKYEDAIVRVDNIKNVDTVRAELIKAGYKVYNLVEFDSSFLTLILVVPLFITIITLIITLSLIYSFIRKKVKYRYKNIGMLKVYGFKNKDIIKIYLLENINILYLSMLISLIIYLIIFHILNKYVLYDFIYNNTSLIIPIGYIILTIVLLSLYIILISDKLLKKVLNRDIKEILEEE